MRAKVWVETEVEVEVGVSDMIAALCDLPEPKKLGQALSGLSTCLGYIKKLPDAMLAELNDKQREIIVSTLEEQAARYKTPNAVGQQEAACGRSAGPECSTAHPMESEK